MGGDAPQGRTLTTTLTGRLRDQIMRGVIPPGARLHIDTLRTQFDVSLSPVREALSRLAAEGLVVAVDQRGYRVPPLSRSDIAEVMMMRQSLETLALREAMQRNDPSWRAMLCEAHDRLLAEERRSGFDLERWEAAHRGFHETLLTGAGMPLLVKTCRQLHDRSDRYRRLFLQRRPKDRRVIDEHRAILDAALAGDLGSAAALLHDHLARTGRNIIAALTADETDPPQTPLDGKSIFYDQAP